jgi:hypothetical protein
LKGKTNADLKGINIWKDEKTNVDFTGSCREVPDKESYNFDLLQLRIGIEMSFGKLTTKW